MDSLSPSWVLLVILLAAVACSSEPPTGGSAEPPREAASATRGAPLPSTALQVAPENLSRVELSRMGKQGARTTAVLEKRAAGWWLTSPLEYRANRAAVEPIVAALAELEIVSSNRTGEDGAREHWVDDARGIEVKAWAGDRLASHFVVGRSHREETYLRAVGHERILAALGRCRPIFDKTVDELRNPVITDHPAAAIQAVTYTSPDGVLELVADPAEPGRFVPRGQPIRNFHRERASQSVGVLAHLMARGFVDSPVQQRERTGLFAEDTPRATLLLRDEAGTERSVHVWVGVRTDGGLLYLRTSETDQIYLVSAYLEKSLVPRRSHFERSDEMMRQLRAQPSVAGDAGKPDAGARPHRHDHARPPPDQVPPELMSALRALARQQRQ